MNRRNFLRQAVATGLGAAAIPRLARAADSAKRPNIVLIMADDLGYECIGANGGTSYKTPVLDKLAAEGIRFQHCYAQPLCTPSRAKIMTGMYNVRNYVKFGSLDRKQTTFAHLLKSAGYATCIVGKWQLGKEPDAPRHFGFDESCLWQHTRRPSRYASVGLEVNGKPVDYPGKYGPDVVSDFACEFMAEHKDTPFLVCYPMILTHCPFEPTPDSDDWDPASKGSKSYKGDAKYFGDMVTYMDKIVGKLVDKLEALGLRENTLVLFTGDNGTDTPVVSMMGDVAVKAGKGKMTDAGTRVPFIANWPGTIPKGQLSDNLVDFADFLPTLCETAGVPLPESLTLDGRSFLPQLKGDKGSPRDWIYCWYSRTGNAAQAKEFARTQRYKLYRTGEFYDIENDVLEQKPFAGDALDDGAVKAKALLQKALDQYTNARPAHLLKSAKPAKKKQANSKKGTP